MRKDPTEFRKRFAKWKEGGKPYKDGKISDEQYVSIMENVAADNWQQWGDESEDAALTRILNDNAYDYRGYYNDNPGSAANADTHWPDEYKTVWHPTFSTQSKYSGKKSQYNPYGYPGGTWQGELFNPQWYQQHQGTGFYKDGYPKLPKFKDGEEGALNMGPKRHITPSELKNVTDKIPVEKGLSGYDPILGFFVGQRALGKMFSIGRQIFKTHLRKSAQQEYREARQNGHSPAMARIIASDGYVDSTAQALDKMTRLLDFGI